MINTPTVLVLGAGASAPYGYPIGLELKRKIVNELSRGASTDKGKQILNMIGDDEFFLKKFVYALRTSGQHSIDSFLEHRTEFMELGKIAIAQSLISNESITDMFEIGDWYQDIYQALNSRFEILGKISYL